MIDYEKAWKEFKQELEDFGFGDTLITMNKIEKRHTVVDEYPHLNESNS